ncbi:MAG: UbiA family prenyltransferase [Sphingobacteriia bacterium]|jgi:1,4-dihydroxy-2-naphthoate octaprenyltransferase
MLKKSTLQLLRFPFSFFLMPVFWFAISMQTNIDWYNATWIFIILHFIVYPSSNGYNSYMDRDKGSIGGIENPPEPLKELFYVSVVMDIIAILASFYVSTLTACLLSIYIVFSRLYSYRGIRLKQYSVIGYLTVVLNQGTLVFAMVFMGVGNHAVLPPLLPLVASAFLIGGFYPITQIYQHSADKADGVNTISLMLGKRGTFIFCGLIYSIAFALLFLYFTSINQLGLFFTLQIFFIPVIIYFLIWAIDVWNDERKADFKRTMRMNWIASIASNLGFITLLILKHNG